MPPDVEVGALARGPAAHRRVRRRRHRRSVVGVAEPLEAGDSGRVDVRRLRETFDQDAELYARARPRYPARLFDALVERGGVGPGSRVVEVGPGTGQATVDLVGRGAEVVAVELGPALAGVLRRQLAGAPVDVVVSAFEDWAGPGEEVDALVAFTAWHWLDPAVRTARAAAVLRPGGVLATVTTTHVAGGSDGFFDEAQRCYERWDPATPAGLRLLPEAEIPPDLDEADDSPLFAAAERSRHQQDVSYSRRGYLEVLSTYSGHRALGARQREALLGCIGDLIDVRHGGSVTKRYLHELRTARRLPRVHVRTPGG